MQTRLHAIGRIDRIGHSEPPPAAEVNDDA
jgi:hypothetical protein